MNILRKEKNEFYKKIFFMNFLIYEKRYKSREEEALELFSPGHFYSPVPSKLDIQSYLNLNNKPQKEIPGINMQSENQLNNVKEFKTYYSDLFFPKEKVKGIRYYYDNDQFSYSDAITLYCMIRKLKPKRIIEVGSGYSTAVMADTNERFFDNKIQITCIEPYPDRLNSLLNFKDVSLEKTGLQNTDLTIFNSLGENDILFIDSTHITKINSDVNKYIFEILPMLNNGVYIHIHDIFHSFEYPTHWIAEGRNWNEIYILRAFLEFNPNFEIVFFNSYLNEFYPEIMKENLPLYSKNTGGSLWLKKV